MKLIKFLLKFILVILIIVVIIVGAVIIIISDKTDDVNINYYEASPTTSEALKPTVKEGFDNMGSNYALDFSFDEKAVNELLFSIIKSKINEEYDPVNGTTDRQKYINTDYGVPDGIPVIGGKKAVVKSCYAEFDDDNLYLNITASALGFIKTRLRLGLNVSTTDDEYVFNISAAKLGKIDIKKGIGKKIFDSIVSSGKLDVKSINDNFKDKGIPLVIDLTNLTITSNKKELGDYITKVVVENSKKEDKELDPSVVAFLGIITNPDNKMLVLSSSDKKLSFNINLEKLKLDNSELQFDEELKKEFSFETFAKSKTQTITMGLLAGGNDNVITFNETELGRLLYTKTNGYESLGYSTFILDDIEFKLSIYGVEFDITPTKFTIYIYVDINGLKTKAVMVCDINYPNVEKDVIHIVLPDKAKLGSLDIDCQFLNDMLAKTMSDDDSILKYEKDDNGAYLVITKEILNKFVSSANSETPVDVTKIEFIENALAIYVGITDPTINALLDEVTGALETAMSTIDVTNIEFDTSDPEQEQAVNDMNTAINNVSDIINNPEQELTAEDTDALVDAYNNLSEENQEAFVQEIQDIFEANGDVDKFNELYNQLFSNND